MKVINTGKAHSAFSEPAAKASKTAPLKVRANGIGFPPSEGGEGGGASFLVAHPCFEGFT